MHDCTLRWEFLARKAPAVIHRLSGHPRISWKSSVSESILPDSKSLNVPNCHQNLFQSCLSDTRIRRLLNISSFLNVLWCLLNQFECSAVRFHLTPRLLMRLSKQDKDNSITPQTPQKISSNHLQSSFGTANSLERHFAVPHTKNQH